MKKAQKQKSEKKIYFIVAWLLHFSSNHCSCPARGCGRRPELRNTEISRTPSFFNLREAKNHQIQSTAMVWQQASLPLPPDDERAVLQRCHRLLLCRGRKYTRKYRPCDVTIPFTTEKTTPAYTNPDTTGTTEEEKPNIFFFLFFLCISFTRSQNWRQPWKNCIANKNFRF